MYTLKSLAIREGFCQNRTAPDFSLTFSDMVERYGRSYEFGLATRHFLKHFPLRIPGMAGMGLGMVRKQRLRVKPRRIKGIAQLTAILDRAKQLELTS
jgi:hypothetical protein